MKWNLESLESVRDLLVSGKTYKQIGELFGCNEKTIVNVVYRKLGIKRTDFYSSYVTKTCLQCGREFTVTKGNDKKHNHKFCSKSCSATYNNYHRIYKHNTHNDCLCCLDCGAILYTGSKYCNNTCKSNYENKNKVSEWLSGNHPGTMNGGSLSLLSPIRKYIFNRANYKCQECGCEKKNPFTGLSILTIDHVDGDAGNNRPDNLRVLCPTCHAMTENYGNAGSRTSARRKWREKNRSI